MFRSSTRRAIVALAFATATVQAPAQSMASPAMATTAGLTVTFPDESGTSFPETVPFSTDDPEFREASAMIRKSLYWGDGVGRRGGLSVQDVRAIAAGANPNRGTFAANHEAAHAALVTAGAFPNPSLDFEFGRQNALVGGLSKGIFDLSFAQPIELPGKRLARRAEAEAGFPVVEGEALEFASGLSADIVEAYFTVQFHAAQERLWQTLLDVAEELRAAARVRVELGEAGVVEEINARVEALKARRERDAARRRRLGARAALNALAGGCLPDGFQLSEPLPEAPPRVALPQALAAAYACHPRLFRLKAELEKRYAGIDRQNTEWWPDLKLGLRKTGQLDSTTFGGGVGLDLPLWNRNQGGIAAARAAAHRAYNDIVIAANEIRRDVETAYQNLEAARAIVTSYDAGLKQAAEQAMAITYVQYRQGATSYLDVLTARRLLQETEQGYIQARFDCATARARMDRAIGLASVATKVRAKKPTKRPDSPRTPTTNPDALRRRPR